jgi:hypothetical protein
MALRYLFAAITVLAAPVALAATPSGQPGTDTATAGVTARTTQPPRRIERTRPGTPLKPRVIEAPGAALMMIPASYDPSLPGPFSPL